MAELITIALGRFLLMLISLLNVRLYTTFLSHDQVGRLALLSGTATILSLLIDRSISAYWYRMVRPWARTRVGQPGMRRLLMLTLGLGLILYIGIALIRTTIGLGTSVTAWWLLVTCGIGVFFNSAYNALLGSINVLGARRTFVILSCCSTSVALLVATLLARQWPQAEWWMTGNVASQALIFPLLVVFARRALAAAPQNVDVPDAPLPGVVTTRAWLRFAIPALFAAALYAAQMLGYRYALNAAAGPSEVGMFTVGFGIGVAIMNAFDYFATQFLLPHFLAGVETFERDRMAEAWNRYAVALIPATILVGAMAAGAGPFIIRILAAPSFAAAGSLVAWGVAADSLRLVTQGVTLVSQARLEMRHVLLPSFLGVATSIGGVLLLAPRDPLSGTGVALVTGAVVWLLLQYRASKSLLPVRLPWRQIATAALAAVPLVAGLRLAGNIVETLAPMTRLAVLAAAAAYLLVAGYLLLAPTWLSMGRVPSASAPATR